MNDPALIFLAACSGMTALGLLSGGERCDVCRRRGPFVAYGRFGRPICHRCHKESE